MTRKPWPVFPLSKLAEVRLGRQRSPKNHSGPQMRLYLRAANVGWNGLILDDVKEMNFTDEEMATYALRPGDLLLGEASGSPGEVGKPALWKGELAECAFQNTLLRVRSEIMEPEFLLHFFRHQALSGRFIEQSRGVGIHHLGRERLAKWPTPQPPPCEQRRIVAILEEHLSDLDDARASLSHVRARSAKLLQCAIDAQLEKAVSAVLTFEQTSSSSAGRPPDLEFIGPDRAHLFESLEALTDPDRVIRYGILKPHSDSQGDVPYVEVRDLKAPLSRSVLKRTTKELDQQYSGARLRENDVLIAVRGSYERTRVVPAELENANISRDVARIAPLPGLHPQFLHYWLQSTITKRYLHRHARGVAVKGVNIGSLRALPVPHLPMANQLTAVAEIMSIEDSVGRLDGVAGYAESRVSHLRRAILAAAFSGRLTGHGSDTDVISELAEKESA